MTLPQFDLDRGRRTASAWQGDTIPLENRTVPVLYRRNHRARRYRLTLGRDGLPRITIPRRGSRRAAEAFVLQHRQWLLHQLDKFEEQQRHKLWQHGTSVLLRGQPALLQVEACDGHTVVRLGPTSFVVRPVPENLRPEVEAHLRKLALRELPERVQQLAAEHRVEVRRVIIRAQVSRWGSCSRHGTISLNWRLIHVPDGVRDYVIVHELMHLRELNHSARFWALVAKACPSYQTSEAWLRQHSQALL